MLEHIVKDLTEQKRDGSIEHPEFNPNYDVDGWPMLSDPENRKKLERFVLKNCISERHRFKMADGKDAIVYFDSRGRATSSSIEEISDSDLMRMAKSVGPIKPSTGKYDHGYVAPVQEGNEDMGISDELMEGVSDSSDSKDLEEMRYHVSSNEVLSSMKQAVTDLLTARVQVRKVHEYLNRIYNDATGVSWTDNYQNTEIDKVRKVLYKMDGDIGSAFRSIESLVPKIKKMVVKK